MKEYIAPSAVLSRLCADKAVAGPVFWDFDTFFGGNPEGQEFEFDEFDWDSSKFEIPLGGGDEA